MHTHTHTNDVSSTGLLRCLGHKGLQVPFASEYRQSKVFAWIQQNIFSCQDMFWCGLKFNQFYHNTTISTTLYNTYIPVWNPCQSFKLIRYKYLIRVINITLTHCYLLLVFTTNSIDLSKTSKHLAWSNSRLVAKLSIFPTKQVYTPVCWYSLYLYQYLYHPYNRHTLTLSFGYSTREMFSAKLRSITAWM